MTRVSVRYNALSMAIVIDGEALALDGIVDLGGVARIHMLPGGDAFVIAAREMTRDGRPLVGRATRLEFGHGALLRVGTRRFSLGWRADSGARTAAPWQECRLCFGGYRAEEAVATCTVCDVTFHGGCYAVLISCPGCAAPRAGAAA